MHRVNQVLIDEIAQHLDPLVRKHGPDQVGMSMIGCGIALLRHCFGSKNTERLIKDLAAGISEHSESLGPSFYDLHQKSPSSLKQMISTPPKKPEPETKSKKSEFLKRMGGTS